MGLFDEDCSIVFGKAMTPTDIRLGLRKPAATTNPRS
jgi:hypothetical protein